MARRSDARRIGILGGTFNPVHIAHLRGALEVAEFMALDELRLIPSARPPHREAPQATAEQRLAMVELAVAGEIAAGEEAADCRCCKSTARLALFGHCMAIKRGYDRGSLARKVHQDRGCRPAILRPIENAGQHDQRSIDGKSESEGQKHGDCRDRPQSGQHADSRAEQPRAPILKHAKPRLCPRRHSRGTGCQRTPRLTPSRAPTAPEKTAT